MNLSNKILSLYLRNITVDVTILHGVKIPTDVICIRVYHSSDCTIRYYISSHSMYREIIACDHSITFIDIVS